MADVGTTKNPKDWTARQRLFIEWLGLPSEERIPLTQGSFARVIGVHETTLSEWKRIPGFEDAVKDLIMARFGDVLHDVIYSFKREAMKGSYQHQRMYLEMMGLYTEKRVIDLNLIRSEAEALAQELGLNLDEVMAEIPSILKEGARG